MEEKVRRTKKERMEGERREKSKEPKKRMEGE